MGSCVAGWGSVRIVRPSRGAGVGRIKTLGSGWGAAVGGPVSVGPSVPASAGVAVCLVDFDFIAAAEADLRVARGAICDGDLVLIAVTR